HGVHDDDVGGWGVLRFLDIVGDAAIDATLQPALGDQLPRCLLVAVHHLDVGRVAGARLEQLDLEAADAAPDLQHRGVIQAVPRELVNQPAGGPGQPLAAVAARIPLDRLRTEDGAVAGRR